MPAASFVDPMDLLMADGRLPAPVLYISSYFESHRPEYYARLQAVRERGEINEWVQFFCAAVMHRANDSAVRMRMLIDSREQYRAQVQTDRSSLPGLVDVIFRNPVITVTSVMRALRIAQPTAANAIERAVDLGWLNSMGRWGRGGKERWLAHEIWRAVASEIDAQAA